MNTQNKPHQHAELIHAWADGKTIQTRLKESQEKWKDFLGSNMPLFNDKHFEYRIKPEKPSEPWKPENSELFWFVNDFGVVDYMYWSDDRVRCEHLYSSGNCFPNSAAGKKRAAATAERVKATLKGENVGSELEGKPMSGTGGEKMKITKDQFLNFLTDLSLAYELPPLAEKVEEVIEALQNEVLEIEGYEQSKWVKLDPNDESTYPQRLTRVLVCDKNKNVFESFVLIHNGIREFVGHNVTHWRPLPPAPGKEEAR